jgi:hypothetical protein
MSRRAKFILGILFGAAILGAFYFPQLRQRVTRLARLTKTEEQARREVVQPPIATPTDVKVKAKLYWASSDAPNTLEAVEIELPLSADPVERSKQLLAALVAGPVDPEQRTLPPDATLLAFYLLPDGTAVADFSDSLASEVPSGILSEQMAVDSIVRTLAANVPAARRLKILIHGQEVETLAGHLVLTGFFALRAAGPLLPAPAGPPSKPAAGGLTRPAAPGKLGR